MLPNATFLDLSNNGPFNDAAFRELCHKNKKLETLLLNNCPNLTDKSLDFFSTLKHAKLSTLSISGNVKITDSGVKSIGISGRRLI